MPGHWHQNPHKTRLNAPIYKKPEQFQGDVRDDLDMDRSVIAHPKPLDSIDIGNLPKGIEFIVPIHTIDDLLQLWIVPDGQPNNDSLGWFQDLQGCRCRGLDACANLGSLYINILHFLTFHLCIRCTFLMIVKQRDPVKKVTTLLP